MPNNGNVKVKHSYITLHVSELVYAAVNTELPLQEGMAYDIIVATTKIISGSSLAETFIEKLG